MFQQLKRIYKSHGCKRNTIVLLEEYPPKISPWTPPTFKDPVFLETHGPVYLRTSPNPKRSHESG